MRLEGRAALVTGAASGIGRAVAVRFAAEGARVALLDKADEAALGAVADEIGRAGGRAVGLVADVSDAAAVDEAVSQAAAEIGTIDIAVNAAGIWYATPVTETDADAFDRMIDTNLKGTFYVIRAVVPGMIEAGGVTSSTSLRGPASSGSRSHRPTRRAREASSCSRARSAPSLPARAFT